MTYTILIPLLITAACFVHFHHRMTGSGGRFHRAMYALMNLGLAFTMNIGTWAVWGLAMWGLS
ncbi:hypothetical protein [Marinobacter sp. OP 3.4]|uniref:hypothetical protein n=1 Tax=Marinobacter sp. OP 3.4 TaxID=3076501 RepID=UPI002E2106FB